MLRRASGELVDSARTMAEAPLFAAVGESGRFDVIVEKPGYSPWTLTNGKVGKNDACVTETARLTARLRRQGS